MYAKYLRIHGGVRYNMVASFIGSKANPSRVFYWISNPTRVWWWWPLSCHSNENNLFGGILNMVGWL